MGLEASGRRELYLNLDRARRQALEAGVPAEEREGVGGGGGKNYYKVDCRVGNFQFQGIFPRLNFNLSSLLFCFLIRLIAGFYGKVKGKYPQLELSIR